MEYREVSPLPLECQRCTEADCYNCDTAGKRWVLAQRDQLLLAIKSREQAIRRYQRQIREIEKQLAELNGE